jgi:hypothetical protein
MRHNASGKSKIMPLGYLAGDKNITPAKLFADLEEITENDYVRTMSQSVSLQLGSSRREGCVM